MAIDGGLVRKFEALRLRAGGIAKALERTNSLVDAVDFEPLAIVDAYARARRRGRCTCTRDDPPNPGGFKWQLVEPQQVVSAGEARGIIDASFGVAF